MDFRNKKVLIFGLGRYPEGSGVSAARFFVRHGARVTVTDLKTEHALNETTRILKRENYITFHLGGHRLSDVRAADLVVRNPGVPSRSPYLREARRRGIPIVTDVSLFMKLAPCPVIGVTGTRGKSTTTALIGEMLRRVNKKTFVGGNIQRSPLTFLDKLNVGSIVVLELSSWLLESLADIRESPWAAVVTNIYPDHLNIHRSMQEYVRAKDNIFRFQRPGDILVLNRDNPHTRRMAIHANPPHRTIRANRPMGREVVWFSMKSLSPRQGGAFVKQGWIVLRHSSEGHGWHEHHLIETKKIALQGDHNIANALAACALALAIGVKQKDMRAVLQTFTGLPSRQDIVRVHRGVMWVNDTTATTPEATIAALQTFSHSEAKPKNPSRMRARTSREICAYGAFACGELRSTQDDKRIVLIAGGTDKNFTRAQFATLAREIKRHCKLVILFTGTATTKLLKKLTAYRLPLTAPVRSMSAAVKAARQIAERGDIVLLSPGAASFGLFENEFDRGDQFVRAVRELRH